ncbi:XRE family transcriptional regulator [Polluticaenibacter yanchengensis]|uniref:Helix-turn-helix transcriptional regulator n=1 Tax=Polluticaenibacter yanchengensis TaxID=3014562 RepID=A0ABT4UIL0_9BACT|nr:helix-turn-helix transcriptional regulator [Chitinophagaceae bacterium LY-5]
MGLYYDFILDFYDVLKPIDKFNGALKSINELFNERLEKYGLTQNQAEKILGVQTRTLEGILNKSAVRVDALNLFKLSQFLGLQISDFIMLYVAELPAEMIKDITDARRNTFIVSNFDIATLKKARFLTNRNDFDEIEDRIKRFFGLASIYEYGEKNKYIPAFSRTKRSPHILMREFWVASAIAQFEAINNPNEYNRDGLLDLMPKIRPYTMNVERGLKVVIQALYRVGVTVIYQPHLTTTHVRGATFVVKNKPCIALTDLNKNYPTIWFALLHELHHVLYDFEDIEKQTYHLTGEADLFLLNEQEANDFARNYLFAPERSKFIFPHIGNHFIVSQYAREAQVHPSIIYSFYSYDMEKSGKGNYWGRFKDHYPDVSIIIKEMQDGNPFEYEAVQESVQYLKENVYNI